MTSDLDGELSYLDPKIGELFEWLRSEGLYEETFILIVGDHGEEFCEHAPMRHQLVDHHFALYDTIVRVPMMPRFPRTFDADVVDAPVQLTDLPATLSEVIDHPEVDLSGGLNAQSLRDPDPDRVALSEYRTPPPQIDSLESHAPSFDWSQYVVDVRMARSQTEKLVRYRSQDREDLYDLGESGRAARHPRHRHTRCSS